MELRHLRYFLAVGDASNFTKAAAQLRVAQPALSRQVRDLEDEIGVELLRRNPRGVRLTAEGRLFLEEVRELLKRTGESARGVPAPTSCRLDPQSSGKSQRTNAQLLLPPGKYRLRSIDVAAWGQVLTYYTFAMIAEIYSLGLGYS
jgi:DNA-binding MarR family transcriptional regulator